MGYRELKNKEDEKAKRIKRILLFVFVGFLTALLVFSFFYPPESWKYYFALPKVGEGKEKEMRVHYLDVGQGDCILIQLPDGKTMLVDGGGEGSATEKTVLRYLNALKIDVIDYLVITHSDNDHCGAIAEVVRMKTVLNAYLPATYEITSSCFAEAYAALSKTDCNLMTTNATIDLSQQGETPYTLSFLYPNMLDEEDEGNESSSVFWLDYMGVSFLFTGDAPMSVEEKLLAYDEMGLFKNKGVDLSSTEIVKLGHHGSSQSSSMEFLAYLHMDAAIVSCAKENAYGHPADVVLDKLEIVGANVYRTDEVGNIIVTVKQDGGYTVASVQN